MGMADAVKMDDAVSYTAPDGTVHHGRCIGMRASGSVMEEEDGRRFRGVRFLVQPATGAPFWTVTFADHGHPVDG